MARLAPGKTLIAALVTLLSLAGCGVAPSPQPEHLAVPDGKSDDYFSPVGQEYDVEGRLTFALSADDRALEGEARQAKLEALARARVDAATRALESQLIKLFPEDQRKQRSGGVVVMLREASTSFDTIEQVDEETGLYALAYRAEVGASNTLLSKLPKLADADGGGRGLVIELPAALPTDEVTTEPVVLRLRASAAVSDAYPRYRELFTDGLDIYIHYGGDYNEARHDVRKAKAMFATLQKLGLKAPVASFDELKLDSEPFTGEIEVGGEKVAVRAKLVHPELVADDELEQLVDSYKKYAASADVVIYSGHAGTTSTYSGVVVHYNPRKAIPASEFRNLDLPDRYQVFVFVGCETYTGYADQLLAHPKKTARNVDILTAVNFTPLAVDTLGPLLGGLLEQRAGSWLPHSWKGLLERVNEASARSWVSIFGVHGLSDNPKISPLAQPETIGQACERDDECPGGDNLCVRKLSLLGPKMCGAACTDHAGCPQGSRCYRIFTSFTESTRQCLPTGQGGL